MNKQLTWKFALIAAVAAFCLYSMWPPLDPDGDEGPKTGKIRLGLDLKGGSSFLLKMDLSQLDPAAHNTARQQAIETLSRRLDRFGLAEPILQSVGTDRILVQLPGLAEKDRLEARRTIERTAYLEFRLVHPENGLLQAQVGTANFVPPLGWTNLPGRAEPGQAGQRFYFVKQRAEAGLTGKALTRAYGTTSPMGGAVVEMTFNSEGAKSFARVVAANPERQLAIILDGEVQSAPVIQPKLSEDARVTGAIPSAEITGSFSLLEAKRLASVLENPLQAPVRVLEERSVDPSLGKDAIRSGINAAGLGAAGVVVFMVVYYMLAGLVANVAMLLNLIILVGVLALFKFTLTLPGIAGIALTIGMSVDANVLIYERIREELAAGKPLRAAVAAGYQRAWLVIFDSNLTTILSGAILIWLGTGPVRGFGVTLTVGLIANLFAAVFATRVIFDWMIGKGLITSLKTMQLFPKTNFDFLRARRWMAGLVGVIVIAGIAMFAHRGGLQFGRGAVYGIDFSGGDSLTLSFNQRVDSTKLRSTLEAAGAKDSFIQYQREGAGREYLTLRLEEGKADAVAIALKQAYPDAGFAVKEKETVGATIGNELGRQGLEAVAASMVMIMIYIAFRFGEFSYGVGALASVLTGVLTTMGLFVLSGRTFSMPVIAAVLTIIGYGINDTIVVFDRIRENRKLTGGRLNYFSLLNRSINDTLSRTLLTGGSTIFATLMLLLLGGRVLNDFAFTFLVGVIISTIASIYIASPIVLWFHRKEARAEERAARTK